MKKQGRKVRGKRLKSCRKCKRSILKKSKICPYCKVKQGNLLQRNQGLLLLVLALVLGAKVVRGRKLKNQFLEKKELVEINLAEEKIVNLSVDKLLENYNEKLKGNTLAIQGNVESINIILNKTYVILEGGVSCYFKNQEEIEKTQDLKLGQEVNIVGKLKGKEKYIKLGDCKIQ